MQQEIPEFDILYIYNVPAGCVLNKNTADQYELIECGTWISKDRHWLIQYKDTKEKTFELIPNSAEATSWFFNHASRVGGTLDQIFKFIVEWKPSLNS